MIFKFKKGLAKCEEFQLWRETYHKTEEENITVDTLFLMFPNYTKNIELKEGAIDFIEDELLKKSDYISLKNYEMD